MTDSNVALIAGTRAYWDRWKAWLDAHPDADEKLVSRLMGRGEPPPDRSDMAVFVDDWKAATAVRDAFMALRRAQGDGYPHTEKKINTIVAIVDTELVGGSVTALLKGDDPDVCNFTTYHKKWKFEPEFAACLTAVRDIARNWEDGSKGLALAQASRLLAVASPKAAQKAINHIDSQDPNVSLRASLAVLDRAGVETAAKSSQELSTPDDGSFTIKHDDGGMSEDERLTRIMMVMKGAKRPSTPDSTDNNSDDSEVID